ncbi:uncharacterized protein LOC110345720 [Heterocephalus glaber]|uniref:Uncharacterized protein LOC110345720 n=1 Tax=Heterocephalus glaber TaxID=10181 RepID=A0AAX6RTD7_HETGA|nr:uncharacterized protein LOC110345720 [Heterocephalus glaber]
MGLCWVQPGREGDRATSHSFMILWTLGEGQGADSSPQPGGMEVMFAEWAALGPPPQVFLGSEPLFSQRSKRRTGNFPEAASTGVGKTKEQVMAHRSPGTARGRRAPPAQGRHRAPLSQAFRAEVPLAGFACGGTKAAPVRGKSLGHPIGDTRSHFHTQREMCGDSSLGTSQSSRIEKTAPWASPSPHLPLAHNQRMAAPEDFSVIPGCIPGPSMITGMGQGHKSLGKSVVCTVKERREGGRPFLFPHPRGPSHNPGMWAGGDCHFQGSCLYLSLDEETFTHLHSTNPLFPFCNRALISSIDSS